MLNDFKEGDVTYVKIDQENYNRHANVIFMGAKELEVKNIYKSLNLVKPDAVLI
jgi:hypothetical protein